MGASLTCIVAQAVLSMGPQPNLLAARYRLTAIIERTPPSLACVYIYIYIYARIPRAPSLTMQGPPLAFAMQQSRNKHGNKILMSILLGHTARQQNQNYLFRYTCGNTCQSKARRMRCSRAPHRLCGSALGSSTNLWLNGTAAFFGGVCIHRSFVESCSGAGRSCLIRWIHRWHMFHAVSCSACHSEAG